jgi:hypothetical protein
MGTTKGPTASPEGVLAEGAEGSDVALAQQILIGRGFFVAQDDLRRKRFGRSTGEAVTSWRRSHGRPPKPVLEPDDLEILMGEGHEVERVVSGVVSLADGTPVEDLLVVAIDRDFRAEQRLGQAVTDRAGRYRITYTAASFSRAEKEAADLGVVVMTKDEKIISSPRAGDLVMQAPIEVVIDVTVDLGPGEVPSEFERIVRALEPLTGGVPFEEIATEGNFDEAEFLAREADVEPGRLVDFVVAHRVTDISGIRPEYFYALLREDGLFGVGPDRPRVIQLPVGLQTEPRTVLFEAVLLEPEQRHSAIRRALRKRLVEPRVEEEAKAADEALEWWRNDATWYIHDELPRTLLTLLEGLLESDAAPDLAAFAETLDIADLTSLYQRLDTNGFFKLGARQTAETRLKLAELLGFNVGLVDEVTESLDVRTPDDLHRLARLERKDWTKLIRRRDSRVRLGHQKIDPSLARRQSSVIVRRFERAYPTVAFSAQLSRRRPEAVPDHADIAGFLDAHPDFDLGLHRIIPFLRESGDDPTKVAPRLMRGLERIQRAFQLTGGEYRKAEGLLQAGYGSSADIVAAGRTRFVADARRHAAMSKAEARDVFGKAENTNLAALIVGTNLRTLSGSMTLEGASGVALAQHIDSIVAEQPDLASLFGSTDVCECTECRSIYGPGAYFADVMRFLRNRLVHDTTLPPGPGTKTAKDVLFERRPDLGEIDLNCDNALIPVPHIDLVCELAENAIAPDPGFAFAGAIAAGKASAALVAAVQAAGHDIADAAIVYGPHAADRFMLRDKLVTIAVAGPGPNWTLRLLRQTHGTAEERAAAPEYVNPAAYVLVAAGKAAFGLPFDLFHAETRALLAAAGIDRAELMQALTVAGAPSDTAIAGERLGLSAAERDLIFVADVADQARIWSTPSPNAATDMANLDLFNRRTALEYDDIDALIGGAYVRGSQDLFIRHLDNSCDLAAKVIINLDDAVLDRIHRVLRLARKTSLATRDIDRLAVAPKVGGGDLGANALASLATLRGLAADLRTDVGRLITWLDVIPTTGDPSEHALLFQNPAATGPLDARLTRPSIAQNEADETANPGTGARIATVAADVALALGASNADVDAVLERLADPTVFGLDPPLSFATLAALNGRVQLARALGLRAIDLVRLERLASTDPLAGAAELRSFVDAAHKVADVGAAPAELEYLLARTSTDLATRDLADLAIQTFLEELRASLVADAEANRSPYEAALSAFEQLPAFEALLQRRPGVDAASIAALAALVRLDAPTTPDGTAAKAVLDASFADLTDLPAIKTTIDTVVAAPTDANRKAMLDALMGGISNAALRAAAIQAATAALSSLLALTSGLAAVILEGAQIDIGGVATRVLGLLTEGSITDETVALSAPTTPDLYRAVRLLHAVSRLLDPFDPSPETVAFMLANASALGWLRLDGTRFEAAAAPVLLNDWLELADAFDLLAKHPPVPVPGQPGRTVGGADVLELALGAGSKSDLLDALAVVAGWPRDLVGDADTRLGLANADYRAPATWAAVDQLVGFLHTLGVPIAEAVAYASETLGEADRRNARRMLRARYTSTDWLAALKAIMDPLRELKRDALIAYLLAANPALTTPDLYDHFLTATQWSAKMPSSRIVQAHSTLQLFIQRCIAGLEPKATAALDEDPDWSWWDWMQHFRVWQVPRKVFLYAPDYLRPEWRDDKTESFAAFETDILQNEITDENVEAAFEGYLDRLDDIAFLDVLATSYDFDRSNLHVFGATKGGDPRVYYHRVMQRERSWTPWQRIDLDVSGEHLVSFFRNKRLYLAWATFLEKGDDQQEAEFPIATGGDQPMPKSQRRQEIKLAISEYTGKRWRPRRVSQDVIATPWDTETLDLQRIHLTVNPAPQHFTIDLWQESSGWMQPLGSFLVTGCKGYPEAVDPAAGWAQLLPLFKDTKFGAQRLVEQNADNDDELAILNLINGFNFLTLFGRTPGTFRVTYPYQASEIDRLINALLLIWSRSQGPSTYSRDREGGVSVFGTLMPFFFEDNQRGYVLVPGFYGPIDERTGKRRTSKTFSDVRQLFLDIVALITKYLQLLVAAQTPADKQAVLDQLAADAEYARILAEIDMYRHLRFGTVVHNFYHPLACFLRERFSEGGLAAVLARATQLEVGPFRFEDQTTGHAPTSAILPPYPREELEFDRISAYSDMNWELMYHAWHLVGSKLMEAELFDEAEPKLRFIFDPLGSSNDPAPQRYWKTKPFYLRSPAEYGEQMVTAIMDRLARDPGGVVETELADAVLDWRRNPLKPYLVARSRPVAFQEAIVHKTAELYMGRGNKSFRRDQLEDLVLAELDYSRVEQLLGPRPRIVPPAVETPPETYNQLEAKLDLFGNALVTIENLLPDISALPHGGAELPPPPVTLESLYFCIPPSEKLFDLWDELETNEYNLRNSRTIDGVERTLSLFAPPLSVEALIAAAAAGLSISQILDSLSAPRPPYRFRVMLRHAIETADVAAAFSRSLEQAITTGDSEGLARLKNSHEVGYLREQTLMLDKEIEAAGRALENAQKARQLHQESQKFYAGRQYMNEWEIGAATAYGVSFGLQAVMAIGYIAAGGLVLIPKFMVGAAGFGGSPTANAQIGGDVISQAARDAMVGAISATAAAADKAGSMLEHQGTYSVRKADWEHTAAVEQRETERADIEIKVAEIRKTIATEQRRLHTVKQQQTAAEETYLRTKFTNRELFDWLAQNLRSLSKQMFNVAMEAAKAAERCYNFEAGTIETFVRAGQWNDTRRGLLAADNLVLDVRKMESARLKGNVREREITKDISLARLDPTALLELRTTGRCTIQIPEAFFDLDHPGHYFRRIKALSVSIPSLGGPYRSVPLKLTQTANRVRVKTSAKSGAATDFDKYVEDPGNDSRFSYNVGSIESIETSHGRDDSGLFALSLEDERYLPLEGSGACGTFVLEHPQTIRPFDYATISDVVLHMRYTARDGGGTFKTMVANAVRELLNAMVHKTGRVGLFEAIDLRRDRPDVWHRLVTTGSAELLLTRDDLPYFATQRVVNVTASRVLAKVNGSPANYGMTIGGGAVTLTKASEPDLDGLLGSGVAGVVLGTPLPISVPLPAMINEAVVVVNYEMTPVLAP